MIDLEKFDGRFTMRLGKADAEMMAELAKRLHRSRANAVRLLVREYLVALKAAERKDPDRGRDNDNHGD